VFRLFTIKFHFYFFTYFRFKFFASLHFSNFCFEAKQSLFTIKFHFYFFTLNFASLRFSNFRFEVKRGGKLFRFKRSKTVHFLFSIFVSHKIKPKFSLHTHKRKPLNFRFASIFSLNFRLFYFHFRFRFLVFRIEVNHVKSGFFSLPSETKFLLQFQISLPKRK
jgi:hypothetical protein